MSPILPEGTATLQHSVGLTAAGAALLMLTWDPEEETVIALSLIYQLFPPHPLLLLILRQFCVGSWEPSAPGQ